MNKVSVAVLGASGMIGQRFVQMLEGHPYFEISGLFASERSAGKTIGDVLKVRDHKYMSSTMEMPIEKLTPKAVSRSCRIAFSGLPTELAKSVEQDLAEAGLAVFSNASAHRMREDVPIMIPEVNADHFAVVMSQPTYDDGGFIVTNANCSSTGIAAPLKALDDAFGLKFVTVSTYQALSGAGYPGVPSLDIMGNVIPYIGGEEEKMEIELHKMLGSVDKGRIRNADFTMLANCARVPVVDGHLESLVVRMEKTPSLEQLSESLSTFKGEPQRLSLPSAPIDPIIVRNEPDRPQPALDVLAGEPERARGMAVVVGRLRRKDDHFKLFVLSHNTLRGGAGGSILNAELAVAKGLI